MLAMKFEDLTNKKFNKLLVISLAEKKNTRYYWLCKCDCGNNKIIAGSKIKNGQTKSCGCLNTINRKNKKESLYKKNIKYHPSITTARKIWKKRYSDGISFEEFYKLSQMPCHYCGSEPSNIQNAALDDKKSSKYAKENGYFKYNGLDRIDNNKSHVYDNCVPCCKWCNYAKRERNLEDFKIWIQNLYKNLYGNS